MTKKYVRNDEGLIEDFEYIFAEDGTIDWRAMIPKEHLYPNKDFFNRRNTPIPDSIEGLQDHELCIKLAGIRKLAKWRGFSSVKFNTIRAEDHIVSFECCITWIPNKEEPYSVTFSDAANASVNNTNGFGKEFLETIAANRSFVRTVRNYLGLDIVGFDELKQGSSETQQLSGPIQALLKAANLSEDNFDGLLDILRKFYISETYRNSDTKNWKTWEDIPNKEIVKIIKCLKNANR